MSFETNAEQTRDSGHHRVSFNIEKLRQKKDKTPEEEAYIAIVDKARTERKQLETRAGERDESQIKTVREQVARVQEPHKTEHPVQFFKAADVEAAVAAKKKKEDDKEKGAIIRKIHRLGQIFKR